MAEKGLSLCDHCQGRKKEQRAPVSRSQSLPWQRCSLGAQSLSRASEGSLLSVALSSARAMRFYHAGLELLVVGFSL